MTSSLRLTNTATGKKEAFTPKDPSRVTMYVCGPTVYDRAHLGNARSAAAFDLMFRVLRGAYGSDAVVYARNFTDIDDKIISGARMRYGSPSQEAIRSLTEETIDWYHQDMDAIGILRPTHEPRATKFVDAMIADIERMIEDGHAYHSQGHIFFSAMSNPIQGHLSGRTPDDEAAHRVEPNSAKRHPADFVLWKPSTGDQPSWDSPFGPGRPGWHIECSAMATRILGQDFDIHGGGSDLAFPHHDNEVAQAKCCAPDAGYANLWMHNGMVAVNGQKMSKSLGNFITVEQLRSRLPGGAIRLALLSTHYRGTLDWTQGLEQRALQTWKKWADLASNVAPQDAPKAIKAALHDDLNTAVALAQMHAYASSGDAKSLSSALAYLGISLLDDRKAMHADTAKLIETILQERRAARAASDFHKSDRLRDELSQAGIDIKDGPDETHWSARTDFDPEKVLLIKIA